MSNVHKIGGAHLQCVNNRYANFEYKVMKPVEVTLIGTPKVLRMGKRDRLTDGVDSLLNLSFIKPTQVKLGIRQT